MDDKTAAAPGMTANVLAIYSMRVDEFPPCASLAELVVGASAVPVIEYDYGAFGQKSASKQRAETVDR